MTTYIPCSIDDIPAGVRWLTPPECGGQIVEVSYADSPRSHDVACHGSAWRRVIDHSDRSVAYARRDDVAPATWLALGRDLASLDEFELRTDAEGWSRTVHGHDALMQREPGTGFIRDARGRAYSREGAIKILVVEMYGDAEVRP